MFKSFEDVQKAGKDNLEVVVKTFGATQKGAQAIATEVQDYSKKSFDAGKDFAEKLFGVKSLDKAIELQTAYAKSAYEGFVAHATKVGEMYTDLAKEAVKPFEGALVKTSAK